MKTSLFWILLLVPLCAAAQDTLDFPPEIVDSGKSLTGNPAIDAYNRLEYTPPAGDSGEILIDFENDESESSILTLLQNAGVGKSQFSWFSKDERWVEVQNVNRALLSILSKEDGIEIVEPNYYYTALYVPNDPYYKHQWHLDLIGMQKGWDYPSGGQVTVAVIDTGIAYEKFNDRFRAEDLGESQFVSPYNFVRNNEHANDDHGHGTHVAGTIAQLTNNGVGVAGVAPNVKLMPLKVLNSYGYGTLSDIAAAIRYAADHGAQVINMSLGGPFPSRILHKAIQYAAEKGVTIVCAAGNSGRSGLSYPAAYSECISVSAVRFDRKLTWYSSYGRGLTIAAPGGDMNVDQNNDGLMDGVLQNTLDPQDPSRQGYFLFQGTSMAAPHVAAAAALLASHGVTDPEKVRSYLRKSASAPAENSTERYGAGVLNVEGALKSAYWRRKIQTLIFGLIVYYILWVILNKGKSRIQKIPFNTLALLGIVAGATGFFFLKMIPVAGDSFWFTHSFAEWPLAVPAGKFLYATPLLLSVIPAFLITLLIYPWKKIIPLGIGICAGYAAFLAVNATSPNMDVIWLPGRLLDSVWLGVNAFLCMVSAAIASFRLR